MLLLSLVNNAAAATTLQGTHTHSGLKEVSVNLTSGGFHSEREALGGHFGGCISSRWSGVVDGGGCRGEGWWISRYRQNRA